MDQNEKDIIENLFGRLKQAEGQTGARDAEAEAFIREAVSRQPAAPYYMAQAILAQEHALKNLQDRVGALEQELAERPTGGGFLAGLFGAGQSSDSGITPPSGSTRPPPPAARESPPSRGGGGFLGGALQTAAAVTGGVLLGNAIAGLFAEDTQAVEVSPEPAPEQPPESEDTGGFWDAGGEEDFF